MSLAALLELLRAYRFDLSTERAVQDGIEAVLAGALPREAWSREHRLGVFDRPDFFVRYGGGWNVAIEVKASRQSGRSILRQLERYAGHETVMALVLVTNTAVALPPRIGGKFAYLVSLGRAWL